MYSVTFVHTVLYLRSFFSAALCAPAPETSQPIGWSAWKTWPTILRCRRRSHRAAAGHRKDRSCWDRGPAGNLQRRPVAFRHHLSFPGRWRAIFRGLATVLAGWTVAGGRCKRHTRDDRRRPERTGADITCLKINFSRLCSWENLNRDLGLAMTSLWLAFSQIPISSDGLC
jgi:hypothetical protein